MQFCLIGLVACLLSIHGWEVDFLEFSRAESGLGMTCPGESSQIGSHRSSRHSWLLLANGMLKPDFIAAFHDPGLNCVAAHEAANHLDRFGGFPALRPSALGRSTPQ